MDSKRYDELTILMDTKYEQCMDAKKTFDKTLQEYRDLELERARIICPFRKGETVLYTYRRMHRAKVVDITRPTEGKEAFGLSLRMVKDDGLESAHMVQAVVSDVRKVG